MQIGIDARFYGSVGKGLGRYTERLIHELERLDTHNEYVIFLAPENFDEYTPMSPNFRKVLVQSRWYSWSEQLLFPWLLRREHLDLVHFPHFNVPLLYRKRFILTLHDLILFHYPTAKASTRGKLFYWFKFLAYRIVLTSALKRAASVITVSQFTADDIIKHYPQVTQKLVVTKEAVESFCYLGGSIGHDILKPYLLYVGNAYPHKNLELFVTIAARLPQLRFVLVGKEDFFYARLKKKVQAERIENIIFAGYVTDQELGSLYRNAFAYIFPSLYEGFGLPPLEAMQYGTPVIASDRGSLLEILGSAALYFDPTSPEDVYQKVALLLENQELRRELQEKGYRQVAKYSWEEMAILTLAQYQNTHTAKHGYSEANTI